MSRVRWSRAITALALVAFLVAGCASPEPALYTIAPVRGAIHSGGPRIVVLQRIGLARYLERSEIVRSSEDYRLAVMTNNWWGEPLSAMLGRVLIEELSQRLPGSTILSSSGAVSVSPDATVEVDVVRLDEDAAGRLVLFAHVSVELGRRAEPLVRTFRFTEAPPAPGTPGEVAAISTAVGRLADGIAAMLASGGSR